jgi:putative peptidoglycan lipid II flippase
VRETIGSAMRLVAFLNVPSSIGLAVLAAPIISLIYQHGRFGADAAAATAGALVCYALGLYAYSGVKVLAPAFYALDEPRTAVLGSVAGMLANVGLNVALWPVLGYRGVALGTSVAAWVNFAVLGWAFSRRHGGLGGLGLGRQLGQVLLASVPMAAAAWGAHQGLLGVVPAQGLARQLALGLAPVAAGGLAYLAAAWALRCPELFELVSAVRRRSARRG